MNLTNIKSNDLRRYLHTKSFEFSISDYPLKILEELYGCELSSIHKHLGSFKEFERSNDQSTLAHKVFTVIFKKQLSQFMKNL